MQDDLVLKPIPFSERVKSSDSLAQQLVDRVKELNLELEDGDVICVASKVVSISENRLVDLNKVSSSDEAKELHNQIPRKDERILQLILNEVDGDISKIKIVGNWIGAKAKVGRFLTSGGIDRQGDNTAVLLPQDPDKSAAEIGEALETAQGKKVGVIISDSDGREDIAGSTQLCIGIYGMPPLRKVNDVDETTCDMIAAAAGILMGQRDALVPAVLVRGFKYKFDEDAHLQDGF